jgi:hypothetical protein
VSGPIDNSLANNYRERSNNWTHAPNNGEIIRVVRARLTFRQVPANHLLTPATITLRRASGIATDYNRDSQVKPDLLISSSLLLQPGKGNKTRPTTSTYLITTYIIDFITSLICKTEFANSSNSVLQIQSGFDIKRTIRDIPDRNGIAPGKHSVTS